MAQKIQYFLLVVHIVSCQHESKNHFNGKLENFKDIRIESVEIDSIVFPTIESSYSGFLRFQGDSILFIDKRFGWIFGFDKNGNLTSKTMGQGEGPSEINTGFIDGYLNLPNGKHIFLGSSFDVHLHDIDLEREKAFVLGWYGVQSQRKVRETKDPNPAEFGLYTLDYEHMLLRSDNKGNVYIPIYGESRFFNGMVSESYYKHGRILAQLNLQSEKVENLYGRRSPNYLSYKYLPHHGWFSYDISDENLFYVSHEIDSLIYVYNEDFDNIYSFGNSGKGMNTNYRQLNEMDLNKFKDLYFNDRPKRGYYSKVEFFDEFDLLFRSYKKGIQSLTDGLQVYKNNVLIADLDVPKGLNISGYIEPYFYSEEILDDENLSLKSYRIQLPQSMLK